MTRTSSRLSRTSTGGPSVTDKAARTAGSSPPSEDGAPRRGRPLLYVAVGAVAVAVGAWGALTFQRSRFALGGSTETSPSVAPPASETAATVEPPPLAPDTAAAPPNVVPAGDAENAAPAAASATVTSADAADAGAADAGATDAGVGSTGASADGGTGPAAAATAAPSAGPGKPSRGGGRGRGRQAAGPTAAPEDDPGPPRTVSPAVTVNSDLSMETCYATMPDGTKKVVPCK
jgi:serine/threonine-protein kinase